jgi:Sulfatase-modifying factor enzyme 1
MPDSKPNILVSGETTLGSRIELLQRRATVRRISTGSPMKECGSPILMVSRAALPGAHHSSPARAFSVPASAKSACSRRRSACRRRIPSGQCRRFLDRGSRGHQRPVRGIRRRDRLCDCRRATTRPGRLPGAPEENLQPGSMVFTRTAAPVNLRHINLWWTWTPGASWRHPEGTGSSISGREDHPVVHVAL